LFVTRCVPVCYAFDLTLIARCHLLFVVAFTLLTLLGALLRCYVYVVVLRLARLVTTRLRSVYTFTFAFDFTLRYVVAVTLFPLVTLLLFTLLLLIYVYCPGCLLRCPLLRYVAVVVRCRCYVCLVGFDFIYVDLPHGLISRLR